MDLSLLHPRDQIAMLLARIYTGGMTTTSGGNISVRDADGSIWITPAAIDKGTLSPRDIVRILPDGQREGLHRPSSELPFHQAIYRARPDVCAIVHAHPPALVSFSIVRQIPDTRVIPQAQHVCGKVGYAPYETPGSEALGESIAREFESGHDAVIMENHGTVVGGVNLFEAFQRFETLEFCARTIIRAKQLGRVNYLTDEQIRQFEHDSFMLPEFTPNAYPADERELRADICRFVERACRQRLMTSSYGTMSHRWHGDDFLITPTGFDRQYLQPEHIVRIQDGHRESGKLPSRSVLLHKEIYRRHPHVNCVITTQSPNATAFSVSGRTLDTHSIPESYLLLKEIPVLPYGCQFENGSQIADTLSKETRTVLIQSDSILVTGESLLETFDRLEVAEFSARSLIDTAPLGEMVPIGESELQDLRRAFPWLCP